MTNAIFARDGVYFAAPLLAAALPAVTGCAAIRGQDASGNDELLAAAGFQMRRADSPELVRNLESMPRFKLVARGWGGDVVYTYADPVSCRCLYVGGPKELVEYQCLATERQVEEGQLWAESDGIDWGLWGSGWWLR